MRQLLKYGVGSLVLLFFVGCGSNGSEEGEDRLLARVENKSLYLSQMEGMFPMNATAEDTSAIITAFANRWLQDAVLLNEAERNVPSDLNIDKLVRDYRASLIRTNYEKILVEQKLDSMITQAELSEFYEKNKEQYQLETPIIRCDFIKVPLPVPEAAKLRRIWNSDRPADKFALADYCQKFAEVALLKDSVWYSVEDIASRLPKGTITVANIGSKREFTQQDDHHQYYFRLFELINRKDIAPLSYIEEQARKVILHKRKLKVLEQAKRDVYDRELRRNNIETFYEEFY